MENITIGVEIEFLPKEYSFGKILQLLNENEIIAMSDVAAHFIFKSSQLHTIWRLKEEQQTGGYELNSPIMTPECLDELVKVCDLLKIIGCTVDSDCGLHVHIGGLNDIDKIKNIVLRYSKNETVFDLLFSHDRREDYNEWCLPIFYNIDKHEFLTAKTLYNLSKSQKNRLSKINIESLRFFQTIEFRQHQGSIDAEEIINWIQLIINFVKTTDSNTVNDEYYTLTELCDSLCLSNRLKNYYKNKKYVEEGEKSYLYY